MKSDGGPSELFLFSTGTTNSVVYATLFVEWCILIEKSCLYSGGGGCLL